MRHFISKSHKLQGKLEFQGLSISIENKAGSHRHWYDPNSATKGMTKMKHPYGFIEGTLGTDGDEVDVFVGPAEDSTKVFVITQMKKPGFTEIDEQKVMLGFHSATDAKKTYLQHYDDPKFFGSMKELTMSDFKEKLTSHKGKLIKHLFLSTSSAKLEKALCRIKDLEAATEPKEGQKMDKSCEHNPDGVTCEKCSGTHSSQSMLKGLTARMLSMVVSHKEKLVPPPPIDPEFQTAEVSLFGPQVAQAAHIQRDFEPPVVPAIHVNTPAQSPSPLTPDFLSSCGGCGYMHKSLDACPRCARNDASNREATPIWRR